jgi:hypothetical protein
MPFSVLPTPVALIILTVAAQTLFYLAGTAVGRVFRLQLHDFFGLYVRMIVGLVAVVGIYAVLSTRGNTVLWLLLLAFFMMLRALRAQETGLAAAEIRQTAWGEWLLVVAAGILFTAIRLPLLYNFDSGQLGVPYYDFVHYARLTYPLNELGVETNMVDPFNHAQAVAQPYHYVEIWLNALLVRATGLLSIQTLYISTYSTLIALAFIGYCAIYRHFGHGRGWAVALGLVSLPLTGLFIPLFTRLKLLSNLYYDMSNFMFVFPKLTVILLLIILAYLLYLKGRQTAAGWVIAAVPVVFISTAPALALAAALWALYRTVRERGTLLGFWQMIRPGVVVLAGFALFYLINSRLHHTEELQVTGGPGEIFASAETWRHAHNFLIGLVLALGAYNILYLLLLAGLLWISRQSVLGILRRHENLLVLTGLIFGCAGLCWVTFMPFYEGWQFFNNITLVVCPVMIVLLLADVLTKASQGVRVLALLVLGGAVVANSYQLYKRIDTKDINHQFGSAFLQQLRRQAPALSPTGGFVLDSTDYAEPFSYNSVVFMPGLYVHQVRNNVALVSLTELNVNADTVAARYPDRASSLRRWIEQAPISQFYAKARRRNPRLSRADAQRQFVLRHRINFVCVSKAGKLPATLQPLVQSRAVDPITGEQFYRLKL